MVVTGEPARKLLGKVFFSVRIIACLQEPHRQISNERPIIWRPSLISIISERMLSGPQPPKLFLIFIRGRHIALTSESGCNAEKLRGRCTHAALATEFGLGIMNFVNFRLVPSFAHHPWR